jgi:hypothetical protein
MNTKVKLDRLEHYIPSPSNDGLLYVDDNEEKMVFKPLGELNAKFGRDNITAGFNVEYDDVQNKFIISSGQTTVYKRIGYTYDNNGLHIQFPMWGLNGVYQFEEQDIATVEKDDSTTIYTIPNMTSNTSPYGKCSHLISDATLSGNVYDIFNTNDNEIEAASYPVISPKAITYMFDANGEIEVKPISIYIRNGSLGFSHVSDFKIQGTKYKHPDNVYVTNDWVDIKDITLTQPAQADKAMSYTFNTNEYYKGFRFLFNASKLSFHRVQLTGITKNEIGNNTKNKYFLCHILRNGVEKNIFVASYNDIPVFDNDTLIDFLPINTTRYMVNDFDNQVYYETNGNSVYTPDLTEDGKTEVIITPDGIHSRELFEYTVDNGNIISYYPKTDLATSYVNRFIIAEQQGAMGYKIYSDGWKIQWGNQNNPTFPVAFEDKPLIISPSTATNVTNIGMTCNGNWIVKGY